MFLTPTQKPSFISQRTRVNCRKIELSQKNPATAIFYLRDEFKAPRVTVCLMKSRTGIITRGLALCSMNDNPSKKDVVNQIKQTEKGVLVAKSKAGGITWATNRALEALQRRESSEIIWRKEAKEVLEAVGVRDFIYKSEYDTKARNYFEERIIEKLSICAV